MNIPTFTNDCAMFAFLGFMAGLAFALLLPLLQDMIEDLAEKRGRL